MVLHEVRGWVFVRGLAKPRQVVTNVHMTKSPLNGCHCLSLIIAQRWKSSEVSEARVVVQPAEGSDSGPHELQHTAEIWILS